MSDKVPQLRLNEAARTLVAASAHGVLSTLCSDDGSPYGSLVDYCPLDDGDALLLLSDLAEHQRYLSKDPRASLLIAPPGGTLADARLSVLGRVETVAEAENDGMRGAYLARHPQAEQYIDFGDFHFYRLHVTRARFIAGFGRMGWLDEADYRAAVPDLLATQAAGAIEHMNADHANNLRDYARAFGQVDWAEQCRMTGLDRYGFDLICSGSGQTQSLRLAFDEPLRQAGELRPVLVEMAKKARQLLQLPG